MSVTGLHLFHTPIGVCAVGWRDGDDERLAGAWLPDADAPRLRARLQRWHSAARESAPTPMARAAAAGIAALLAGERRDLREIALDWGDAPDFERRVWAAARAIDPGRTCTYGELAAAIGEGAGAARAVGQALGRNRFAPIVPCHRVLAAGRASGGFSAPGGIDTKLRMLEIERARFGAEPGLFDAG